ncbi:MAG: helix-turn-helix domain-containing protein [Melioribacteraceae bacterium]|nr:helix-turn-helix domain-containing protein [Melioribacteraceae bacterium]
MQTKQKSIKLYSEDLIDRETEIHYAFHKSLKSITTIHTHNFYELFLVVSGEVIHVINEKMQKLSEGSLVFIRKQDIHYYKQSGESECNIINLAFRESTLKNLFEYLSDGFPADELLEGKTPVHVFLTSSERDILSSKLQNLNTIPRNEKRQIKTALRILLFEIFIKYFSQINEKKGDLPEWLDSLTYEMQKKENFTRGIKNLYILSNRTPEHLSRVFKKYYNISPTGYINELRLNYAANLLTNSDENIVQVSLDAGFENLSHFYHLFKKKFTKSPAEFRNQNQKSIIPF